MGENNERMSTRNAWFGHTRETERLGSTSVEAVTAPISAWSTGHQQRLLQTRTIDGLVPTLGLRRGHNSLTAYQLNMPGSGLSDAIQAQQITQQTAISGAVESAARALHNGHLLGLVHGDLQIDDVRLVDGDIAVAGMGLAEGGTPGDDVHVAPEIRSGGDATPLSDVYSLGRLLESALAQLPDPVPSELRFLVLDSTATEPARRPPSARAFADRLRGIGGRRSRREVFGLAPLGHSQAANTIVADLRGVNGVETPANGSAGAAVAATTSSDGDGKRRAAAVLLVALVAAGGVGLWALARQSDDESADSAATQDDQEESADEDADGSGADDDGTGSDGDGSDGTGDGNDGDDSDDDGRDGDDDHDSDDAAGGDDDGDEGTTDDEGDDVDGSTEEPTTTTTEAPLPESTTTGPTTTESPAPDTTVESGDEPGNDSASLTDDQPAVAAAPLDAAEAATSFEILHAVPGAVVDLYIDGQLAAPGFSPGTLAGPLPLDTGAEFAAFAETDGAPTLATERPDAPLLSQGLSVDESSTLVIYADDSGMPTSDRFVSDLSALDAGQSRLSIGSVAAGQTLTVTVDGSPTPSALSAGDAAEIELAAGTHRIVATDADGTVILDQSIETIEGGLTSSWIRPDEDGGYTTSIRRIQGLETAPAVIPSGESGLAAEGGMGDGLVAALLTMAACSVVGVILKRRSAARVAQG